ncbi:Protein-S-isoprenylcysteine O-methyltransferase Ste14 [Mesorhizobium albiziae]|uniref:Protein-S-isoprenylcysteine O-methyltransferase Ste14 n=1 Tax=Neomesorhizobium albiziae TaxID=335020 RepID=A0A1I4BCS3_9HYPH|nr:isoprenylcysteine carboxylmethyltransferase family protein [Mesorhizobium albiziae]GLS29759.1 sodium:proton antiporter [Mesorhizobium albiziae]SFK66080.1 Protein-S-isoprenylcysteine O-methyltransferase Ste14 [Mesorhizobium albiziae]
MTTATPASKPKAKSFDELSRYQRRRRLVLALLVAAIFLALFFVASAWPTDDTLHEDVEAFGIGAMLIAILGRSWCTLYIGGRKSAEIVRGGPYSVTRNPLYVFSTIGAAGIGAMTGSITVAVVFAVLCYAAFHAVILVEEAYLEENFGEPYRQYMREVPRFFPNPSLFKESEMLTVRPQLLYRTFADGLLFLAAYPFFEFVEYLQQSGALPVLLRFY